MNGTLLSLEYIICDENGQYYFEGNEYQLTTEPI